MSHIRGRGDVGWRGDRTRQVISELYEEVERVAAMATALSGERLNLRRTALEISTNAYAMLRELAMALEALELLEAGVEVPLEAGSEESRHRLTPRQVLLLARPPRG